MKKVQLSFCLLLIATALQAQVTIGPKLGLNVNYENYKFSGDYAGTQENSKTAKVGYQAGVAINLKTSDYFSVRPEVLFNVMGGETSFGDGDNNTRTVKNTYNYLSVPLNFVGTFDAGPGKFNIFVAPQFSIGLNGKYSYQADSSGLFVNTQYSQSGSLQTGKVPDDNNGDTGYFNQMAWGINYGIGYQIKGLLFTGQYHMGLTNTQPHYANSDQEAHRGDVVSKNYGFTIGLTYFFGDTDDE
ncbi:MAG: porin family protein [Cytophaga sp.]|uniref:porin family protein n=1 Tax=Cytophaga sp. TaxID=29535 RepID=UPI003F822C42